ncbi:Acyl-coenzyme A thioesterase PaaI, contains HGG motif [Vibrio xiamenensis]|uniref:Acyl-coenzyme A thioesterase PaaI, contains HGG motif n=1 Tax=Vibrio xiamenensis TaxID=861298 RepID=A0A1G8E6K1_9VIBR|nr:DUF4442 domain-containing protein [Vibrio xiamenensis]SDH65588.1 Acyl-coenzyme A thioesterase PaaI, contains HGG motif [Vibrio xiamenensis]
MNSSLSKLLTPRVAKTLLNAWPPFWGAGIKITEIGQDFRQVKVKLKLRWWNKNANRTQYGGSIFSLTDPIYALMLMRILGEQYYVWDKEASINFIKPGQTDLFAEFLITQPQLDAILSQTMSGDKHFPCFDIHIKNADGEVVSHVQRKLYVRKKSPFRDDQSPNSALTDQS